MFDLLMPLFDTSDFPARWNCGNWSAGHGWLHVLSDLGVWSAYVAIPCVLGYFVVRRKDIPFRKIFLLFGAFILACGTTHLMEAIIFWWPAYRLAGAIKLFTAIVSWGTVLALVQVAPKGLAMRSPEELEREITARKEAENALREANADLETRVQQRTAELAEANASLRYEREMLRITLASIGDAVIATDLTGRVTFLNSVAQTLTGWNENDARAQALEDVFQIVNEKTRNKVQNPVLRALNEGTIVGLANHTILIARDSTERAIDDSAAPIRHEDGTVAGAVLVFRDVTEQRKTEQSVRSLAAIVQSSDDAIIGKDIHGVITSWNEGAERIFGYTPDEAIGQPVAMLAPQDRADEMPEILTRLKNGERIDHFDTVRRAKDGRLVPISLTVSPIKDEDGEVIGASKIARDISERKRAGDALQEEKARLRATLTGIGDAVIVTDVESRVTLMNPVAEALTGWSKEAAGQPLDEVFQIINEQTRQPVESPVRRVIREGTIVGLANHTALVAKDGTERPIEDSAAPIWGEHGQILGVVLVFRDATEQRRAEKVLRQSEARFRQIADSMAQIVWTARPDGNIDFLNRRWSEFTGLPQTAGNDAWGQLLHPDDARPASERWTACLQTGAPFDMEIRLLDHRQQCYRWHLIRTMPIHDDAGKVVRWFGTSTDIHEQKRAEECARFLAEASNTLAAVVDYTSTLQKIARLAVPFFADWCVVDMAHQDGSLRRLAVAHIDPEKVQLAADLHERYPPDPNDPHGAYEVLRTGTSKMMEEIPDSLIDQGAKDEEHLRIIRSLGLKSYMCVPLRGRERTFGVLSFVSAESGRRYTKTDLALAEELAQRSAIAIENAQLYAKLRESEAQFRQLADFVPQMVWTARPDGYLDYYNERWYEYTGFPRDEYGEQSWKPILHPDDVQRCVETYFACISAEKPYQIEYRFKDRRTGGHRWFLGRAIPVRDDQGRVVRWFGTCTDIDDTKKVGERLSLLWEAASVLLTTTEPVAMLRELFAKIGPHFGLDTYLNYMVNETGDKLRLVSSIGIPEEMAKQITPLEFGQAICGTVASLRQPILATHIQQSDEPNAQLVKSLGIRAYVCNPLQINNDLLGTLSFGSRSRDNIDEDELEFLRTICHYVAVAYERLRLVTQLRDADRRKDEFLATLAHELRNPLAPLRNAVELMRRSEGDTIVMEQARSMLGRQLDQMVRLVDDLLDMSRISRGKVQVRKQRVELAAVVRSAVETVRPFIDSQAHELTITLPPQAIYLDADPTRLAQVISNLLNNAAKYTEKGGHIWLTVEQQEKEVALSVRDTGIGIAAEHLRHIFDMFSQVAPALERSHGGLGIGLSLVRGLVELHGGAVEARSAGIGMGSEFIVRLPVVNVPLAHDSEEPPAQDTITSGRKSRILVVDDNQDAADSLALMLKVTGHETRTAYDGLEATQAAAAFLPDVILLDIGLPKMNGYEVAQHIRQQPWGSRIALIALTGWGQEEDKRRAFEAGFDHHLTKPVQAVALEKLLALINPMRQHSRSVGESRL